MRWPIGVWLGTRLILLVVVLVDLESLDGDLHYYVSDLGAGGLSDLGTTLPEYPTPAALYLGALRGVSLLSGVPFAGVFIAVAVLLDALLAMLLVRDAVVVAQRTWLWGAPLLGPLAYTRFDLLPAVLAGVAVLWLSRRPGTVAVLATAAAAAKLWPIVILPALVLGSRKP